MVYTVYYELYLYCSHQLTTCNIGLFLPSVYIPKNDPKFFRKSLSLELPEFMFVDLSKIWKW